jgi:hypothetical protein
MFSKSSYEDVQALLPLILTSHNVPIYLPISEPISRKSLIHFSLLINDEKLIDSATAASRLVCQSAFNLRRRFGRTTNEDAYSRDLAAYTASISTVKFLLNAVVSKHAYFETSDIENFYLGTLLDTQEYMYIPYKYFLQDQIIEFNLQSLQHHGHVMVELTNGIYELPQAGILAQRHLFTQLANNGYSQCPNIVCLFQHSLLATKSTLVVDDFAIKYAQPEDLQHLLDTLSTLYTLKTKSKGSN